MASPPRQRVFGDAEKLLLEEARARFDLELRSAATLHSKSALFLTATGVFAALTATAIGKLGQQPPGGRVATLALVVLVVCLGTFAVATVLLARSALSRSYQMIATPSAWTAHLAVLQSTSDQAPVGEDAFTRLQFDLLDAWMEAVDTCAAANAAKAATLHLVTRLISAAVPLGFLGILLSLAHARLR